MICTVPVVLNFQICVRKLIHTFKGRTVEKHTIAAYFSAFYIPNVHSKSEDQYQSKTPVAHFLPTQ
jgi:hypothetical protein